MRVHVIGFCIFFSLFSQLFGQTSPIELELLHYMDRNTGDALRTIIDDFNASQNRIRVTANFVALNSLKQRLQVASKVHELPDLVIIDNPDMAAFAQAGILEDLSSLIKNWPDKEAYFPGPWKSSLYRGKNYGIPISSNSLALFYNKKIFNEAQVKVPETWDELRETAKKLSTSERYGIALSAIRSEEGTFNFLPWLWSAQGTLENLNSPAGIKALRFLRTLIEDGSMSRDVVEWTQGFVEKQFALGKAAMMINGPYNLDTLRNDAPNLEFGLAQIPRDRSFATVLGGENIAVCKGANIAACWEFLKYFCSKSTVNKFINLSAYFPPRKDILDGNERWLQDPIMSVFIKQMQYALPRGPHPKWPEISDALSEALQQGLLGILSPEAALTEAQKKIRVLMPEP